MSLKKTFTKLYAAGPATTTILTITETSATPKNILVKIVAVIDDTVNFHHVDASHVLTWNGAAFSSQSLLDGTVTSIYSWSTAGATASFQITPNAGFPAGKIIIDLSILPNIFSTELSF